MSESDIIHHVVLREADYKDSEVERHGPREQGTKESTSTSSSKAILIREISDAGMPKQLAEAVANRLGKCDDLERIKLEIKNKNFTVNLERKVQVSIDIDEGRSRHTDHVDGSIKAARRMTEDIARDIAEQTWEIEND